MIDLPYRPAAGVMLLNSHKQVFVAQRLDTTLEAWQMPQGGLDNGEEAEAGALRELAEETGIAAHLVEIIARSAGELVYDGSAAQADENVFREIYGRSLTADDVLEAAPVI